MKKASRRKQDRRHIMFYPDEFQNIRILAAHEGKLPGPFVREHMSRIVKRKISKLKQPV